VSYAAVINATLDGSPEHTFKPPLTWHQLSDIALYVSIVTKNNASGR
jgi:hypothetical protein